jgi:ATP-binding protein involved in chromosome partitioning
MSPPRFLEPTSIEVDREHGVTIEWEDGHVSRFGLEELRLNCQCAECRGLRERDVVIWPRAGAPETLRVETADLVGADSISVVWNDTHRTGIYSSETLRAWCHCPLCASGE